MKEAVAREFKALRREAKRLRAADALHFEARINNLEKRIVKDIENEQARIDDLRRELMTAIGEVSTRTAALERGEAGITAADRAKEQDASRLETWKLAILGAGVTVVLAVVIFVANLLTGHP